MNPFLHVNDHSTPCILWPHIATQMWCLARLLPLMVGEKIVEDDPSWANFLLLLTIADYVLAPVTSQDMVAYLRVLIGDHHQAFKDIYPHCRITPKMHYLIHYPECMERYASVCVTCMLIVLTVSIFLQVWTLSSVLVYAFREKTQLLQRPRP